MPFGSGVIQHMNYAQTVGSPPVNLAEPRVRIYQLELPLSALWPQEKKYDWSLLENWLNRWTVGGKRATVCVKFVPSGQENSPWAAGCLPAWLAARVQTVTVNFGTPQVWPVVWDPAFQALFAEFVQAFARRYDGDDRVEWVLIGTGVFCSSKAAPPPVFNDPGQALQQAGYTDANFFNGCLQIAQTYANAFSKTWLMFGTSEYVNGQRIEMQGFDHLTLAKEVVGLAVPSGATRPKVGLFYHNLRGTDNWKLGPWPAALAALSQQSPLALGLDNAASASAQEQQIYGNPITTAQYGFGGGSTGIPPLPTDYYELYADDVSAAVAYNQNYQPDFDTALTWLAQKVDV